MNTTTNKINSSELFNTVDRKGLQYPQHVINNWDPFNGAMDRYDMNDDVLLTFYQESDEGLLHIWNQKLCDAVAGKFCTGSTVNNCRYIAPIEKK